MGNLSELAAVFENDSSLSSVGKGSTESGALSEQCIEGRRGPNTGSRPRFPPCGTKEGVVNRVEALGREASFPFLVRVIPQTRIEGAWKAGRNSRGPSFGGVERLSENACGR